MTFDNLLTRYRNGDINFDVFVAEAATLNWGTKVKDEDGNVDWEGDNLFADVHVAVLNGDLTTDERKVLLDAVTAANV